VLILRRGLRPLGSGHGASSPCLTIPPANGNRSGVCPPGVG
jgi:hypothetical protein